MTALRSGSRIARVVGWLSLAFVWSCATGAEVQRWAERTAPVFRLVASQSSTEAGIPYSGAPGILAQDADGFIWIGTETGLERWDGYRLRTYTAKPGDPCALQSDNVWALHVDGRKKLWIGSFGGGVSRYDPETDCIRPVGTPQDSLRSATVESLAEDGAGGLWVGTSTGLQHVAADLTVTPLDADASDQGHLSHARIARLLRDRSGAVWVGTDRGLERRASSTARFAPVPLESNGPVTKVRALFESADGRIWVGTSAAGAYVIDPATMKAQPVKEILALRTGHGIWAATETAAGEIWLATHDSGIVAVDPESLHIRVIRHQKDVPTSLPDDSVFDLLRDRRGLLWVVSNNGWVGNLQTQDGIATILTADESNGLAEGAVAAMAPTGDDRLAVAVGAQMALIGPTGTGSQPLRLDLRQSPDKTTSIALLNARDLFAGINPIGLVWIDRAGQRTGLVPLPGAGLTRHVSALLADGGRLWVGAFEGLWAIERAADPRGAAVPWSAVQTFDLPNVLAMAAGPGGIRWFGTTSGLFRSDSASPPTQVHLTNASGVAQADPFVTALHADRRGRLWLGTNTQGLYVLDPSTSPVDRVRVVQQFLSELPNPSIDRILEDARGFIWVSTDRGLARIDGDPWVVHRIGRGDGAAIVNYWIGSGVAMAGELLFGGQGGITVIRPDRFPVAREPPPIVITRISVGRREVPSAQYNDAANDQVLEVPADAQRVEVEFSALDFSDPEHNSYEYRLAGYDRNWVKTGFEARVAMYTNLAPGMYRLRLRGTDHAGVWSPFERQLTMRVAAAWDQTMWFRALEAAGVLLALVLIVQASTALLRARQRELELLVDERTRALVRATEARNSLIESLAHDLRTPLTSLRGYLDRLSIHDDSLTEADRSRFIGIAERQAERLIRLVRELFELVRLDDPLARLALESFRPAEVVQDVIHEFAPISEGRSLECELDRGVDAVQIIGDISLFQRLIDNLVDNALSHTPPGGKVTVRLGAEEDSIVLEVSDTGRGIERADLDRIFHRYERGDVAGRKSGAGLGLAIVKRILELHRGSIVVDSDVGCGSRFTIRLPRVGLAENPSAHGRAGGGTSL